MLAEAFRTTAPGCSVKNIYCMFIQYSAAKFNHEIYQNALRLSAVPLVKSLHLNLHQIFQIAPTSLYSTPKYLSAHLTCIRRPDKADEFTVAAIILVKQ
jgi:hypothetical protein